MSRAPPLTPPPAFLSQLREAAAASDLSKAMSAGLIKKESEVETRFAKQAEDFQKVRSN